MKRIFMFMLALCFILTAVPVFAANPTPKSLFPNMQDHWAQGTIDTMTRMKAFVGYPDGNFYPDRSLTRAEFLASLGRAVDMGLILQDPHNSVLETFSDVKSADWYGDDVHRALERGWITTKDNGKELHPNDPIPRKEMARIIAKVLSQMNVDLPKNDLKTFTDVDSTHPYFSDIFTAVGAGILNGYADGTFHPEGTLTRAEASTVMLRTLQLDHPKSPYASEKFRGAWEPAKAADMFLFGGWEEAMVQKGKPLDLSALHSFASDKAVSQYKTYLEFVRTQSDINSNMYGFWMGDFYPKYVNNNLAMISWYLTYDKKIDNDWYRQKTETFTILIKRESNRKWVVQDFPISVPLEGQKDWHIQPPTGSNHDISFKYQEQSGDVFYGNVLTPLTKNPQQSEAIPTLQQTFKQSPGRLKILRIMGLSADETTNASLVKQLDTDQPAKQAGSGLHELVVVRTGNWFEFIEGDLDKILNQLWTDFNYNGGQYIPVSIDNVPWAEISDDPFWRKLQAYESSQKVKDNGLLLSQELQTVLQKYKK